MICRRGIIWEYNISRYELNSEKASKNHRYDKTLSIEHEASQSCNFYAFLKISALAKILKISIKLTEDSMMWYMKWFSREFSIWASIWLDDRNASSATYNLACFQSINHTRCTQWYSFTTHLNTWNKNHLKHKHKNQIKIDISNHFSLSRIFISIKLMIFSHIIYNKEISFKINIFIFFEKYIINNYIYFII